MTYTQGNYVTPSSEKLADIVQVDPIYASFAISERDFRSMFDSDVATMRKTADIRLVLADDTLYPSQGTVAFIDNKIDSDTGTVMIWRLSRTRRASCFRAHRSPCSSPGSTRRTIRR